MTKQIFNKTISEIEKGCGALSQGKIKGLMVTMQCGNTGFKNKLCLCEVCRDKLSLAKSLSQKIEDVLDKLEVKYTLKSNDGGFLVKPLIFKELKTELDEL